MDECKACLRCIPCGVARRQRPSGNQDLPGIWRRRPGQAFDESRFSRRHSHLSSAWISPARTDRSPVRESNRTSKYLFYADRAEQGIARRRCPWIRYLVLADSTVHACRLHLFAAPEFKILAFVVVDFLEIQHALRRRIALHENMLGLILLHNFERRLACQQPN